MILQDYSFANVSFLWALTIIPFLAAWLFWRPQQKQSVLRMSSLKGLESPTFWTRMYPFLWALRLLAIALLIVALARPRTANVSTRTKTTKGINDRIGLVVYAGESYTKTPITSDKAVVTDALSNLNYERGVIDDGTAIGMGLATAVNRLKDSKALSKVIILLTDGVNNAGFVDPTTAAGLASSYGIKTYTIGLGSNGNAMAPIAMKRDGSFRYGLTRVEIDEEVLKSIAEQTGGVYFRATDNQRLASIYDEINKLEKTEVEEFTYTTFEEHFRIFILFAMALLLLEWILRITVYKSIV